MFVVYLSPAAERGGAEAVLIDMLKTLRELRPDWSLHLISGEDGPLLKSVTSLGIGAEVLPFAPSLRGLGENRAGIGGASLGSLFKLTRAGLATLAYRGRLRRRLKVLKPDIVHTNGMKMHLLGALALPTGSSSLLVWHFHDYLSARPMMSRLLRRVAKRCQTIIANSNSVAEDARFLLPGTKVETIYNSVDPSRFSPDGPRLDVHQLAGERAAPEGTIKIGLVATFAFWKGHEVFLRAATLVSIESLLRFYVIGGPVYATPGSQWEMAELKKMAQDLGISDRMGFTGFVDDVAGAMRSLDIVVHASTEQEPFGLAIIQAMACGCAVISTATGGAGELITPEGNAVVVAPSDPQALAGAIERLAQNANLRARLGKAGRKIAKEGFSPERMGRNLASLYERMQVA